MRRLLPWLFCLLFLGLTASRLLLPAFGTFSDDGVYISTARSLAEGRGYVIDTLPGAPPNTKYPPLHSAILALVFTAGLPLPGAVFWLKLPAFLFLLAWLAALFLLARDLGVSRAGAGWVLACALASDMVAYCAAQALSDVPCAALATWTLLWMVREEAGRTESMRRAALVGALAGLASLARSQGVVIVAAAVLLLSLRRRFRAGLACLAAAAALYGPWVFWQAMHPLPEEPLLFYYSATSYRTWWAWRAESVAEGAWVVLLNSLLILTAPAKVIGIRNAALALAAGSVVWIAAAMSWRRCSRLVLPLLASTVGMVTLLLVWTWLPERMLLAAVPLLFVLIACRWNGSRFQPIVAAAALLYCAAGMVNAVAATWMSYRDGNAPLGGWPGDRWVALRRLSDWLKHNTPPGAVVGSLQDGALPLLAERPVIFPAVRRPAALIYGASGPPLGTVAEIAGHLRRNDIAYLVLTPQQAFAESRYFRELIDNLRSAYPGSVEEVYRPEPGYVILRVHLEKLR